MKNFFMVTAQPDDILYMWQTKVQCCNFRNLGYSSRFNVLVLVNKDKTINPAWLQLEKEYPEVNFLFYKDTEDIVGRFGQPYIPVIRPYLLSQFFSEFDLTKAAVLYLDSDVLFTGPIDWPSLTEDDVIYQSDCEFYVGPVYFRNKTKDVLPGKLETYQNLNVLQSLGKMCGVEERIAEDKLSVGGAQTLLKGEACTADFWTKVFFDCRTVYSFLTDVNKEYFIDDNTGLQRWCADMFVLNMHLYRVGLKCQPAQPLAFSWATSPITQINDLSIHHNAGVTHDMAINSKPPTRVFNKHDWRQSEPSEINLDEYKDGTCNEWYVQQIKTAYSTGCNIPG